MAAASTATVTITGDRVVKRVTRYLEYGVFEREVEILDELRGSGFVPKVLAVWPTLHEIEMEYCGADLSARPRVLPENAHEQAADMLAYLRARQIRHNDVRPENVTVRDGKLFLIDWGWATVGGPPPADWPRGLGGKFRAGWPKWEFDDIASFFKVLE